MTGVRFEHVSKRFNTVEVVHDISIDIQDKEFIVLVGPSGCGKSTCLRMVAGLEQVSDGAIYIGDRLVNDLPPGERDVAMVFQDYALFPYLSVYGNMAFRLKLRHYPKGEIRRRVYAAAEALELQDYLKRKPRELSGGQRQRVALGRAMIHQDAKVFLMDEPLSNLDARLRVQMRAEILKLHQLLQKTTIYVTHDQVEAMTMGSRIAVLNGGRIQQIGAPQQVYDHPANLFVAAFLGSPAMNLFDGARVVSDGDTTSIVVERVGQVEVPSPYAGAVRAAAEKQLTLGIRPESLKPASSLPQTEGISAIEAPVDLIEHLGNELLVYLKADGRAMTARLDPHSDARMGQPLRLQVDTAAIHLFDTETGLALF